MAKAKHPIGGCVKSAHEMRATLATMLADDPTSDLAMACFQHSRGMVALLEKLQAQVKAKPETEED